MIPIRSIYGCSARSNYNNKPERRLGDSYTVSLMGGSKELDGLTSKTESNNMAVFYDDNFGEWEIESEEDLEFYHQVQRENVEKVCKGCGQKVRIRPDYAYCNSCCERMERGQDLY